MTTDDQSPERVFTRNSNHDVDEVAFSLEVDGDDLLFARRQLWMDVPGDRSSVGYWVKVPSNLRNQLFAEYSVGSSEDLLDLYAEMEEPHLEKLFKSITFKFVEFECWRIYTSYDEIKNEDSDSGHKFTWTSQEGLRYSNLEPKISQDDHGQQSVSYSLPSFGLKVLLAMEGRESIGDLLRHLIRGEDYLWSKVSAHFLLEN
jgi:hypothetical protein